MPWNAKRRQDRLPALAGLPVGERRGRLPDRPDLIPAAGGRRRSGRAGSTGGRRRIEPEWDPGSRGLHEGLPVLRRDRNGCFPGIAWDRLDGDRSGTRVSRSRIMPRSRKKTCFISAPFGFDASPLIEALGERDIASVRADDLAPGESIIDRVQQEIRHSDLVCIVLPQGYGRDNLIFEAGLALGSDRPVLVLAVPDVDIPFELAELTYVRAPLSDKPFLGSVLAAYVPEVLSRKARIHRPPAPTLKRLGREDAEEVLRALKDRPAIREKELIGIMTDLFRKVGILTSSEPAIESKRRPDLAIWIDETQSIFGNPILVEARVGKLSQLRIDEAYHQLSQSLIQAKARLGLLIYWDLEGARFKLAATHLPLVICLSIEGLIDSLRLGTFTKTLIAIRNRAMQGVPA
jgi:hypothetical protein